VGDGGESESVADARIRLEVVRQPSVSPALGLAFEETSDMSATAIRWVGVAIDCADAGPVARFYERLLDFEMGDFEPPHWAQLWDPAGGVHLNIQGETWYEPPT
jgi:hypothetical protein